MLHIQWKDRYNIHFREIDAHHRGLLEMLNELIDLLGVPSPEPEQVSTIFRHLCEYAQTHFSAEERYMQAADYPRLPEHRVEHEAFMARVAELGASFDPADSEAVEQTVDFLKTWYLEHITKSDQDYAPFLQRALPSAPLLGVIFALEGVLATRDQGHLTDFLADRTGQPREAVNAFLWEAPGALRGLEGGDLEPSGFFAALEAWAGAPVDPAGVEQAYLGAFRVQPALVNLARGLGQQHRAALTGNGAPWIKARGLETMGLKGVFHATVLSCEAGAALPDPAVFRKTLLRLGVPQESCLYIGREASFLKAAQGAGLQTLPFTTPVLLMAELRRMAIPF
ncbi:MAG: bacteriohemerythrin [Acidobacteria bacterium]|nr:bacteriohemerythrin [Acidobacteriota bacterium]